jgi:tetratricopeptide (TPR) repeat protein
MLFAAAATLVATSTDSCSFRESPSFVFAKRPDAPIAAYTAGRLGVLMPSFAHSHLVVAWRYLAGKPLSAGEQKEMAAYYAFRLGEGAVAPQQPQRDPVDEWIALRNTVAASDQRPSNYRNDRYAGIYNCTNDAFATATATLKSRIAEFGGTHPGVRSWVEAQNAVFSNCEGNGITPQPANASLPATIRLDRNYQIAAAAFYATDFDRAHDLFLAVSRDPASPWRRIARIVAARALIRKGALAKDDGFDAEPLKIADRELRAIAADDDMRGLHRAAADLDDYVQLHIAPAEQGAKLARAIAGGHITRHNLTDYVAIVGDDSHEMTDWIATFSGFVRHRWTTQPPEPDAKRFAHAIERWQSTHSLPWLVASIANANKTDPRINELLEAAAKVEPASPAFATVAYHRARLLLDLGDVAAAKRELDRALAQDLGNSTRNLFRSLRMPLANSIGELVNDAVRLPAGKSFDELADPPYEALFDDDAAAVFNQALPLSSLIEAAHTPKLPDSIRAQLVAAAFTRAIVLGRPEIAQSLLPEMHRDFDDEIKEPLNRFGAAPPSRRRIEALNLLVHTPALSPFITPFEGRVNQQSPVTNLIHGPEHENWWCGPGAVAANEKDLQISGASFMLRGAMAWAKSYPDDPGVPEALALAIQGTQWACPDDQTKKLAASAFELLHSRYGATKWAQQTKYWYSGRD